MIFPTMLAVQVVFLTIHINHFNCPYIHLGNNISEYKIYAMKLAVDQNIMANPFESLMRCFIMTIGEFMELYKWLNVCKAHISSVMGKVRSL